MTSSPLEPALHPRGEAQRQTLQQDGSQPQSETSSRLRTKARVRCTQHMRWLWSRIWPHRRAPSAGTWEYAQAHGSCSRGPVSTQGDCNSIDRSGALRNLMIACFLAQLWACRQNNDELIPATPSRLAVSDIRNLICGSLVASWASSFSALQAWHKLLVLYRGTTYWVCGCLWVQWLTETKH